MNTKEKLENLKEENPNTITAEVIKEALEYTDDYLWFFNDLMQYGCQSWMIWSLIYYKDTHTFYDKHYNEIENIRHQLKEEWIIENVPDWDLKNHYAWLAFEHVAYNIYNQLQED